MKAYKVGNDWFKTNFKEGDILKRVTPAKARGYGYNRSTPQIEEGGLGTVESVIPANATWEYVDQIGGYAYVYDQNIKFVGIPNRMSSKHFKLKDEPTVSNSTILSIEANRPTFVREFKEVLKDGKNEREYVGEWLGPFVNMSAAQVFTSNEISASIRSDNVYRQFAILQEKHVARAKKPEIEFA